MWADEAYVVFNSVVTRTFAAARLVAAAGSLLAAGLGHLFWRVARNLHGASEALRLRKGFGRDLLTRRAIFVDPPEVEGGGRRQGRRGQRGRLGRWRERRRRGRE